MKILITGINSPTAIDICNHLIKKKHKVFGIYNLKKNNLNNLSRKCQLIKMNLVKFKTFRLPLKIDAIIHVAANTNHNCKTIDRINYTSSKNIFNYAKKSDCKKFVFFSTTSIQYEKKNKKKSKYIVSKKKAEKYFKNKGVKVICLRLPSILGPKLNKSLWISQLSKKIYLNKNIKIYNAEFYTNHFIYFKDITKFIYKIIKLKNIKNFDVVNTCAAEKIKIIDLVKMIKKKYNSNSNVRIIFSKKKNTLIDNKKLLNRYCFKPLKVKTSFENFLKIQKLS